MFATLFVFSLGVSFSDLGAIADQTEESAPASVRVAGRRRCLHKFRCTIGVCEALTLRWVRPGADAWLVAVCYSPKAEGPHLATTQQRLVVVDTEHVHPEHRGCRCGGKPRGWESGEGTEEQARQQRPL